MPLALVIMGTLIFVIAVRGNYDKAGQLFNETFFSQGGRSGFGLWVGSIFGLSILFRVIRAPKAGQLFIFMVMIVYFVTHNNVLSQIDSAIQNAASTPTGK